MGFEADVIMVVSKMYRQTVTEAELIALVNHAFSECGDLDGDCNEIRISGVQRYPADPEKDCNWDIQVFNGPVVCSHTFRRIIDEYRSKYNLKTPESA